MNIFENLKNMFNQNSIAESSNPVAGTPAASNDLSQMFSPTLLGGLAGALLGGKGTVNGILKGAIIAGGGAYLWNKYKDRILQTNKNNPQYQQQNSTSEDKAERMIRALVYAAKADGHIDSKEQAAIQQEIKQLDLGSDGQRLVNQVMNEAIDPSRIANGVDSPEEALQLYTLSTAATDIDNPMEKAYIEQLARALNIPQDVQQDIRKEIVVHAKPVA